MAGQRVLPRVRATRSFARLLAAILLVGGLAFGLVAYPQPQPASAAAFAAGDTVVVDTDRLNLREAPSLGATVLHVLLGGSTMTVTGAPVKADGYNWYPVDARVNGPTSGWVAGEFLAYATDGGDGGGDDG